MQASCVSHRQKRMTNILKARRPRVRALRQRPRSARATHFLKNLDLLTASVCACAPAKISCQSSVPSPSLSMKASILDTWAGRLASLIFASESPPSAFTPGELSRRDAWTLSATTFSSISEPFGSSAIGSEGGGDKCASSKLRQHSPTLRETHSCSGRAAESVAVGVAMQAHILRLGQLTPRRASVSRRFFAAAASAGSPDPPPPKTFSNYTIYKGKSAMQVAPLAPTFEQLGAGAQTTSRDGGLLLTFAPSAGPMAYDWTQKQLFSVGVTELGDFLSAFGHGLAQQRPLDFYHDPNKGGPLEGQTAKKLQISALGRDGSVFFNLSVTNRGQDAARMSVPVTAGELEVLCTIARFIIPRALGFDRIM